MIVQAQYIFARQAFLPLAVLQSGGEPMVDEKRAPHSDGVNGKKSPEATAAHLAVWLSFHDAGTAAAATDVIP